jgi:hypothetical protein
MPPWKPVNIFEKYPRYRVSLEASVVPFREAKLTGFDTIHSQPDANRRIFSL